MILLFLLFSLSLFGQTSRVCQAIPPTATSVCENLNEADTQTVKSILDKANISNKIEAARAEVARLSTELETAKATFSLKQTEVATAAATVATKEAELKAAQDTLAALEAQITPAPPPPDDTPPKASRPTSEEMLAAINTTVSKTHPEASRVLVVVNDNTRPEEGTGTKGASIWAGELYAKIRNIPLSNICHLKVTNSLNPLEWDAWHMRFEAYATEVANVVRGCLKPDTKYIQTVYGVPSHVNDFAGIPVSLDLLLAALRFNISPTTAIPTPRTAPDSDQILLVTRLDGPSAIMSVHLVVRAVQAELLTRLDGFGYVDSRGIAGGTGSYADADKNFYATRDLLVQKLSTSRVVFDERPELLEACPNTLFIWQWYLAGSSPETCTFVPGAIGSHLESNTASHIRTPWVDGGWKWVPAFIRSGITATWGATGEPGLSGYAYADIIFNRLLQGDTFANAVYKSTPRIGRAHMVFIGDGGYIMPPVN